MDDQARKPQVRILATIAIIAVLALSAAGVAALALTGAWERSPAPTGTASASADPTAALTSEAAERRRMDLYLAVFQEVYTEFEASRNMHQANLWLAVDTDSLEGLSDAAKEGLVGEVGAVLRVQTFKFSDVRDDPAKFETNGSGNLVRSIGGYMLTLDVRSYADVAAKITGFVWYGNVGANGGYYNATYEDGAWKLRKIASAVS